MRLYGHLNSGRLEEFHNAEQELSLHLKEVIPAGSKEVSKNLNIERKCAQA
jgi:hypothetical protein